MIDEIFDRNYQQSRRQLNGGIDAAVTRLSRSAMAAFHALGAIQYSAPWSPSRRRIPRDA